MQDLIQLQSSRIGNNEVRTVNARELHRFLGVAKDFSDWIKAQLERARLVDGRDYCTQQVYPQKGENLASTGGRPRTDYFLSLDAAKHVGMMAGTDKGFEVRDYFLECERQAVVNFTNLSRLDILRLALDAEEQAQRLREDNNQLIEENQRIKPMATALERIALSEGALCITDAAKTLQVAPKALFQWLQTNGWIYRRDARSATWIGYQQRIESGHICTKIVTVGSNEDGSTRTNDQVRITKKGLARLSMVFDRSGSAVSSDQSRTIGVSKG